MENENFYRHLSILARQGSGSAARSIFGGLVMLSAGTPGQIDSSFASPVCSKADWPDLCLVVGMTDAKEKQIS